MQENEKKINFILYVIIVVVILAVVTFAATYAYFKVSTTKSSTLSTIGASTECLNISYSETGTFSLDYNYPITDSFALANITPVTVTVTNNCKSNSAPLPYVLAITSLSKSSGYISDNKIRTHVKRKVGSAAESVLKNNGYLSNLTRLTSGTTYNYLINDLNGRSGVSAYSTKNTYTIDTATIANNTVNTYKIYLWVDYYEGDAGAYSGSTHNTTYDGTTEGQKFAAAISLVVNAQ